MKKNVSFEKKITFPTMIGEISAIDLEHTLKFVDESNIEGDFIVKGKYKLTEASRLEEDFNYKIPTEIALSEKLDLTTTAIEIADFYYEIENDDTMICFIEVKIEGLEKIDLEEDLVRESDLKFLEAEDERECDGDIKKDEEKEIPHKNQEQMEVKEEVVEEKMPEEQLSEEKMEEEERKEENEGMSEIMEKEEIFNKEVEMNVKEEEEKEEKIDQEEIKEKAEEEVDSLSNIFSSLSEKDETFATYSVYILREEETVNTIIEKYKTTKEDLEKYNDLTSLTKGSKIIIPIVNND